MTEKWSRLNSYGGPVAFFIHKEGEDTRKSLTHREGERQRERRSPFPQMERDEFSSKKKR